jgi:hypothetical protein
MVFFDVWLAVPTLCLFNFVSCQSLLSVVCYSWHAKFCCLLG